MTREFHVVSPEMWADARFVSLGDEAKLLWTRFLTGPEATSLPGLIVTGRLALAEAMAWSVRKFDRAFAEINAEHPGHPHPMAVADWRCRVVWIPRACWHRRRPRNPNEVLGWRDYWKIVPDCDLKRQHAGKLQEYLRHLGEAFVVAFGSYSGVESDSKLSELHVPYRGTTVKQPGEHWAEQEGEQIEDVSARARARARSNSPSPSGSDQRSTQQTSRQEHPPPPSSGALTPPPATIELTQELRDECVMNGWPEPTAEHVRAFLLNAQSKGQLFADWTARFKWWMSEERKRMGRRPPTMPGAASSPKRAPAVLPELK